MATENKKIPRYFIFYDVDDEMVPFYPISDDLNEAITIVTNMNAYYKTIMFYVWDLMPNPLYFPMGLNNVHETHLCKPDSFEESWYENDLKRTREEVEAFVESIEDDLSQES